MKYSYHWLKKLSGSEATARVMAEMLTKHSFEVESMEEGVEIPRSVVVGEVLSVEKHPNADRLNVTQTNVGEKYGGNITIVCGAPNVAAGQKVPVALVGSKLPNGAVIEKASIRDVKSNGMICAEDELGLGKNHEGIMVLPEDAPVGEWAGSVLGAKDSMIELDILANRGHDALSHKAIAREVAAIEGRRLEKNTPELEVGESKDLAVTVDPESGCYRYIGVVLHNVKIGPSPKWMRDRLETCGVQSINNVVDITNYVMLEWGQPLHAFNLGEVKSKLPISNTQFPSEIPAQMLRIDAGGRNTKYEIRVRKAKKGEKLILLDDAEIELSEDDIVITDGEKPIALAGVMGGKDSGVRDKTTSIILESASFDATTIRKTRQRHKLNTESSYRFERDIDPNRAEIAAARAVELLKKYAGAVAEGAVDVYKFKIKPWEVKFRTDRVRSLLGHDISDHDAADILERLGFGVSHEEGEMVVTVPTHRRDIHTTEDIIEEVGRLHGYGAIEPQAPLAAIMAAAKNPALMAERRLAEKLLSLGYDEMLTYSFYSEKLAGSFGLPREQHLTLANPMNPDQALVRMNILPNVLEKVSENLRRESSLRIFEIGKVYEWDNGKKQYAERRQCALVQVLEKESRGGQSFFALKSALENVARPLFGREIAVREYVNREPYWHKSRRGEVMLGKVKIGEIGELHPTLARKLGIKKPVAMALIDIDACIKVGKKQVVYAPISPYPSVDRDISLRVPQDVTYAQVFKTIRKSGSTILTNIELFDVFEKGEEKSFAFHLSFSDPDRTLTKEDADKAMEKILKVLQKELSIDLKK